MFWVSSKDKKSVEPNLKFKFVAQFAGVSRFVGTDAKIDTSFSSLIKTIDLPSLNIDFERAHANEYVHYFQNGQINWEPMNITFYDYRDNDNNLKLNLQNFLLGNTLINENRTTIIEQPVFCQTIRIIPVTQIVASDYPTIGAKSATTDPRITEKQFVDKIDKNNAFSDSFEIVKPRFSKVNFGSYDYSSDEINIISLTVVPEWVNIIKPS